MHNSVSHNVSIGFFLELRGINAVGIIASEREVVLFAVSGADSAAVFGSVHGEMTCACGVSRLAMRYEQGALCVFCFQFVQAHCYACLRIPSSSHNCHAGRGAALCRHPQAPVATRSRGMDEACV